MADNTPYVESGGVWEASPVIPLPAGAIGGYFSGISCPQVNNCLAVGEYVTGAPNRPNLNLMWSIYDGVGWSVTQTLPIPSDALNGVFSGQLSSLSCPTTTSCVAVGSYLAPSVASSDQYVPLVLSMSAASFAGATPASWSYTAFASTAGTFDSVSCPAVGSCVAVGLTNGTGEVATAVVERGGAWSQPAVVSLPLPVGAAAGDPGSELRSVSCWAPSQCEAVGWAGSEFYPASATLSSDGTWSGQNVSLPGFVAPSRDSFDRSNLLAISCVSATWCAAVGYWSTGTPGRVVPTTGPITAVFTGERWSAGSTFLDGEDSYRSQFGDSLSAVSCSAPRVCGAVGISADDTVDPPDFVVESPPSAIVVGVPGMAPGQLGEIFAPAYFGGDAGAVFTAGGGLGAYTWSVAGGELPPGLALDPMTGRLAGTPTEAGNYTFTAQASDQESPPAVGSASATITITPPPPLEITNSVLPRGAVSEAYHAVISASGGFGTDTWSVASGRLPDGLSLDAATGEISGTPSATGEFDFVVAVSDGQVPHPGRAETDLTVSIDPAPDDGGTSSPSGGGDVAIGVTGTTTLVGDVSSVAPGLASTTIAAVTKSRVLGVTRGVAPVAVVCRVARCVGSVEVALNGNPPSGTGVKSHAARIKVLAKSAFSLRGQHVRIVAIALSSAAKSLLAEARESRHSALIVVIANGRQTTPSVAIRST